MWLWSLLATGLSPAQVVRHLASTLRIKEPGAGLESPIQPSLFDVPTDSDRGSVWGRSSHSPDTPASIRIPPAGRWHLAAEPPQLLGTMPIEHAPSWRVASRSSQLARPARGHSPYIVGDSSSSSSSGDSNISSGSGRGDAGIPGACSGIIAPGRRDGAPLRLKLF